MRMVLPRHIHAEANRRHRAHPPHLSPPANSAPRVDRAHRRNREPSFFVRRVPQNLRLNMRLYPTIFDQNLRAPRSVRRFERLVHVGTEIVKVLRAIK